MLVAKFTAHLVVLSALSSPVWKEAPVHQHLLVLPHDRTKPLLCNHKFSLSHAIISLNNQFKETDMFFDLVHEGKRAHAPQCQTFSHYKHNYGTMV